MDSPLGLNAVLPAAGAATGLTAAALSDICYRGRHWLMPHMTAASSGAAAGLGLFADGIQKFGAVMLMGLL